MAKGLQIAEPPRRRSEATEHSAEVSQTGRGEKFSQVAEGEKNGYRIVVARVAIQDDLTHARPPQRRSCRGGPAGAG